MAGGCPCYAMVANNPNCMLFICWFYICPPYPDFSVGKWFIGTLATKAKKRKKQASTAKKAQKMAQIPATTTHSKQVPNSKKAQANSKGAIHLQHSIDIDASVSNGEGLVDVMMLTIDSDESQREDNGNDEDEDDAQPTKKAKKSWMASKLLHTLRLSPLPELSREN
jgi:hypothetical protein